LLTIVWEYVPYTVTRLVGRTSHEMRLARQTAPTESAHAVHLAIQRFHWRWCTEQWILRRRSVVPEEEPRSYLRTMREEAFAINTLHFHQKWTGPPVPYDGYFGSDRAYHPPGEYYGPM
jgi:hypothetical protein